MMTRITTTTSLSIMAVLAIMLNDPSSVSASALLSISPAGPITTSPGLPLTFITNIQTNDLPGPLVGLEYQVNYDQTAILAATDLPNPLTSHSLSYSFPPNHNSGYAEIWHAVNCQTGIAPNTSAALNQITFSVLPGIDAPGLHTISLSLIAANALVGSTITDVKVQIELGPAVSLHTIPEPSPIVLSGVIVLGVIVYRRQRRFASLQRPSREKAAA
jgi:hypothetical protein